jgi:NitT/TauT family transport system ATP-binding protein
VLLGPSGCGKSTLLKAVAGFIRPRRRDPPARPAVEAPGPDRIVVFQEFDQLPPWKTVKQNVMFPLLASEPSSARRPKNARCTTWKRSVCGVRRCLSAHLVRRHEGARGDCPGAGDAAENPADGRAVRRPGCADPAQDAGRIAAALGRGALHLLFVTHSIEEALVVGNRILLLSPHPGRVRAEVHSHQYDLHSLGGVAFQESARRIHRLLFDEGSRRKPSVTWTSTISASLIERCRIAR